MASDQATKKCGECLQRGNTDLLLSLSVSHSLSSAEVCSSAQTQYCMCLHWPR